MALYQLHGQISVPANNGCIHLLADACVVRGPSLLLSRPVYSVRMCKFSVFSSLLIDMFFPTTEMPWMMFLGVRSHPLSGVEKDVGKCRDYAQFRLLDGHTHKLSCITRSMTVSKGRSRDQKNEQRAHRHGRAL